ncbi:MAG: hypothetical protein OXG36_10445 [Caldilineaceae bacterium]|nr:hypothetical protein [Caldilineaceae bacterium]
MDLDHFIIATFCLVNDPMVAILGHRRLRQRGPAPKLADSEVLTMEIVGEYLSLHQDKAIFDYFRRHYPPLLPYPQATPPHHLRPAGSQSVSS